MNYFVVNGATVASYGDGISGYDSSMSSARFLAYAQADASVALR